MLPVYPAIYVVCGFAGRACSSLYVSSSRLVWASRLLVLSCVVACVLEVVIVYPYFIAFFNAGVGGPSQGYKHLVDSSLDWGQGLPALRDFIHSTAANATSRPIFYVSYFGLGNPLFWNITSAEAYSVRHLHSSIAGVSIPKHIREINPWLEPGYYCIGASMLQPVYNQHAPGNWNAYLEMKYRQQARFMMRLATVEERLQAMILTGQVPELHDMPRMLAWMDSHRLGRLSAFFREGEPYAQPSYAFNVYKVENASHLNRLLHGPPPAQTAQNDMSLLSLAVR